MYSSAKRCPNTSYWGVKFPRRMKKLNHSKTQFQGRKWSTRSLMLVAPGPATRAIESRMCAKWIHKPYLVCRAFPQKAIILSILFWQIKCLGHGRELWAILNGGQEKHWPPPKLTTQSMQVYFLPTCMLGSYRTDYLNTSWTVSAIASSPLLTQK